MHDSALIDPAIISFAKPPGNSTASLPIRSPKVHRPPIPRQMLDEAVKGSPARATPTIPTEPVVPTTTKPRPAKGASSRVGGHDLLATATLSRPFDDLSVNAAGSIDEAFDPQTAELGTHGGKGEQVQLDAGPTDAGNSSKPVTKRTRRGTKGKGTRNGFAQAPPVALQQMEDLESSPLAVRRERRVAQSKTATKADMRGDELSPARKHLRPGSQSKKHLDQRTHTGRRRVGEALNGWATEDATDIQEMGDFDFVGNLSKFDKGEVFRQLRRDDTTADEARLVSHNRLPPRAGTAGGKNLHWTENVLDSPKTNGHTRWTSEADESEEGVGETRLSSGQSSRRNTSRTAVRKPPSRKGSTKGGDSQSFTTTKLLTASVGSVRYSSLDQTGSPRPRRNLSNSPFTGALNPSRPSLRVIGSNKLCPCLSPLQMLEFEQFAVTELGLTEDIMTENAGRGIAEVSLSAVQGLEKDFGPQASLPNPTILIVAGNHKTGARSLAAARHLRNHGFRIFATVMGLEREEDLLDVVKQQANAYRKAAGSLLKPNELLERLKNMQQHPTLLVDALLATHTCFEDLRREDQAFYFQLVLWANRTEIQIVSIDVPSGLDASTGMKSPCSMIYDYTLLSPGFH